MGPIGSERVYPRRCGVSFKPLLDSFGGQHACNIIQNASKMTSSACHSWTVSGMIPSIFEHFGAFWRQNPVETGLVHALNRQTYGHPLNMGPMDGTHTPGAGNSVGLTRPPTRFLQGFASKMLQRESKLSPS
eukprot:gene14792-biopygen18661